MNESANDKVHLFCTDISSYDIPLCLNDPFDYVPHPLCKVAAAETMQHIALHPEWSRELEAGKMLGVLVVRRSDGEIGFLSAFSGYLCGTNDLPYFVPPIYDMLHPDGFFRREERLISELNTRLDELLCAPDRKKAIDSEQQLRDRAAKELAAMREEMQIAKAHRDALRAGGATPRLAAQLDDESRHAKAEYRRAKAAWQTRIESARQLSARYEDEIAVLKNERKSRSEALQTMLFDHFRVVDARQQPRSLLDIFAPTPQHLPPAGTGECAAPKLFHYAFTHSLTPLCVAEFWYGASPSGEVRRHGAYYPACRGKCKPLLDYMLRATPIERQPEAPHKEPRIIYEDNRLAVVDKPAGMLSVPGLTGAASVEEWACERFARSEAPRVVHRLDMGVSGVMLIALDSDTYRSLQEQFSRRTVSKRYTAIVEGDIVSDEGVIDIPLRPDPLDRPRQMADPLHGKPSLTRYRVTMRRGGRTAVELEPVTGRTHQLRVHCAAAEGLGFPIVGDTLYGAEPAARIALHSCRIEFTHPGTGKRVSFESHCPDTEYI